MAKLKKLLHWAMFLAVSLLGMVAGTNVIVFLLGLVFPWMRYAV